ILIWPEKISATPSSMAESGRSTHNALNIRSRGRGPLKDFLLLERGARFFYHCPAPDPGHDVSRKAIQCRRLPRTATSLSRMAGMEHHSPEFLKINPLGVIPTLIHDGKPLHESGTICEYLDETFPAPPLRPDTPYERAEMRNWIRHIDGLIGNLIIFNWRHHLAKTASQWSDQELAEKLKSIPSKERQEAWLGDARKSYAEEERDVARAKLVVLLDKMEDALKPSGWLVGKAYSIADI